MTLAGAIRIELRAGHPVMIRSTRPLDLASRFCGLTPDGVLARVPLLFTLCAKAQLHAAQLALAAAQGRCLKRSQQPLLIEAALEYLWRFAIDLPRWAGQAAAMGPFASLRKGLLPPQLPAPEAARLLDRYLEEQLLGEPSTQWGGRSATELCQWWEGSDSPAAQLLRAVAAVAPVAAPVTRETRGADKLLPATLTAQQLRQLAAAMEDPDFCRQPHWYGGQVETGALAYQQHHPWIEALRARGVCAAGLRLLARLLALLALQQSLADPASALSYAGGLALASDATEAGSGIGWVNTARGVLLHRARCDGDRVSDYRILAPTEWNFHPDGVLAQGLAPWQAVAAAARERWLALQVISLDPCVGYQLEVYDA